MIRIPGLLLILPLVALADGPKYKTIDGCDEGRLREWESIIIEADGYPEEQEDARSMRGLNLQICKDMKAGKFTQEQATQRYDQAIGEWIKRVQDRQAKRNKPAGNPGVG